MELENEIKDSFQSYFTLCMTKAVLPSSCLFQNLCCHLPCPCKNIYGTMHPPPLTKLHQRTSQTKRQPNKIMLAVPPPPLKAKAVLIQTNSSLVLQHIAFVPPQQGDTESPWWVRAGQGFFLQQQQRGNTWDITGCGQANKSLATFPPLPANIPCRKNIINHVKKKPAFSTAIKSSISVLLQFLKKYPL